MLTKGWFCTVGCTLAIAGSLLMPETARATALTTHTLDWEQIAQNGEWSDGQRSGSFAFGQGTVNIDFSLGSKINFARFGGSYTPAINSVVNGSAGNDDRTLHLQIDAQQAGLGPGDNAMKMVTEFNDYSNPLDIEFMLYDIDIIRSSWQDRVIVKGYNDGQVVNPVFDFVHPEKETIQVVDPYTLDGIKNVDNNSDDSNVLVSFAGAIDSFELFFTDGDDVTRSNPSNHGISIGDITIAEVPEPSTVGALGLVALAMGGSFLRKCSRKSGSQ